MKAVAQAKGVVEESSSQGASLTGSASEVSANTSSAVTPEALVAEATKLLKGVSLRAIRVESDIDWSWIRSALTSASDPEYCLIDSGATNALRPASDRELESCRVIRVDLASGGTDLRINDFGTLLHRGQCQVILPASYLVELGYVLSWRRRGCRVKHPKRGVLDVTVVKGCPLIPKALGLKLLQEYEERRAGKPVLSKAEVEDLGSGLQGCEARGWLQERLRIRAGEGLTDVDQLVYLRALFPEVTLRFSTRACAAPLDPETVDWAELPWNRRLRRSVARAEPGSVVLAVAPFIAQWKGLGRVVSLNDSGIGLSSRVVFQLLMKWASDGLVGGLVKGADGRTELASQPKAWSEEDVVRRLRFCLLFGVAQAAEDVRQGKVGTTLAAESLSPEDPPDGGEYEALVEWALRRATINLGEETSKEESNDRVSQVFFACDLSYLSEGCVVH